MTNRSKMGRLFYVRRVRKEDSYPYEWGCVSPGGNAGKTSCHTWNKRTASPLYTQSIKILAIQSAQNEKSFYTNCKFLSIQTRVRLVRFTRINIRPNEHTQYLTLTRFPSYLFMHVKSDKYYNRPNGNMLLYANIDIITIILKETWSDAMTCVVFPFWFVEKACSLLGYRLNILWLLHCWD